MKVYIGPYPDHLNMSRFEEWMIKKGVPENIADRVASSIQIILNHTYNKWQRSEQKTKVHIDPYDVWSLDYTLATIIYPALVKLNEVKHGSPLVNDEDVPEHLKSTSAPPVEYDEDIDDNHHLRWNWVMEEMIWAFGQMLVDWESQYRSGHLDIEWKLVESDENGKPLLWEMATGPNNTFEVDREGYRAHAERMANGFRLFGKYYNGLWD